MSEKKKIESQFSIYDFAQTQFADNELTGMCFKLDFKYFFDRTIKWRGEKTLLSVIEEWLWEKHKTWFKVHAIGNDSSFVNVYSKDHFVETLDNFSSPITAKIEGIKKVIKNLHSKK